MLVQGARLVAPLDRTRTLFGIAARLSAAEVHILCVLAAGQGEASAGAREEDADASARERTDSAGALEELEHELQHLDELTEAYPGARDVLIREGLVTPADDRKSRAEDALAMRVTELGRQFLAWTAEPNPPDESHLPAATARPLLGSTR